jgi:hypothetical protein
VNRRAFSKKGSKTTSAAEEAARKQIEKEVK